MLNKGLIQVYTGDGKGKTTAALGLSVRAAGASHKVLIVQLLKAMDTSEIKILESIDNINIIRIATNKKFFFQMSDDEKNAYIDETNSGLANAIEKAIDEKFDVVIFDEMLVALEIGVVKKEQLEDIISNKPYSTEFVFTGRNAPKWLINKADLVTEMKMIKHYYDDGQKSRRGIEN